MVDCKTCEYENVCTMPDFVKNDLKRCKVYQEKKPYTNADRIRSLSDEELAEWLENFNACELCQRKFIDCYSSTDCEKHRKEMVVEWLKSEVKE